MELDIGVLATIIMLLRSFIKKKKIFSKTSVQIFVGAHAGVYKNANMFGNMLVHLFQHDFSPFLSLYKWCIVFTKDNVENNVFYKRGCTP